MMLDDDARRNAFAMVSIAVIAALSLAAIAPLLAAGEEGVDSGADLMQIRKSQAICRVIGEDVLSGRPITSCFYGVKVDSSTVRHGEEITNVRILAKEQLYFGGTYTDGEYNYDGEFIGKFGKVFKYNDNADVFWKVEVGLNGSTLEYCSMRDMEYDGTARTKETCESLNIDIQ
ncbi:MAG: hypothetical protein JXC85_06095 [Candidatus Aenigmarchaeota archaeon]|nr:hypothetical protein [Candidatus Aenigmarchaeota archaeon]